MFALLSPRLWIAAAIAGALLFSHFYAYHLGSTHVRNEWTVSKASANEEARRMETKRQSAVDQSAKVAAARTARIVVDSAGSADSVERLRNAIATRHLAEESIATAVKRADTAEKLLIECSSSYRELARAADGHASDALMLLDGWPK